MDTYLSIHCLISPELEEELPELLDEWPVLGIEIGEVTGRGLIISIHLQEPEKSATEGIRNLLTEIGAQDIEMRAVEADDWMARYRSRVHPFEVGEHWWIDPHPNQPSHAPPGRKRLAIEPRMAFGTGSHESTRAILIALEEIEVKGRSVLDVGTGSGILALASECRGASSVIALDIDDTAVWVAVETSRQQDWKSRLSFVVGPVGCLGDVDFDIVLCNMMTANFLPLVVELRDLLAPTGVIVFSGLLASDLKVVSESLESAGLEVRSERRMGDWASLVAARVVAR